MLAVTVAEIGGDGWESNPPRTPQQRPANGFEDRGRHQPPIIPSARNRIRSATASDAPCTLQARSMSRDDQVYLDEPYLSIRWWAARRSSTRSRKASPPALSFEPPC